MGVDVVVDEMEGNLQNAQKRFVWAAVTGLRSRGVGSERAPKGLALMSPPELLSHPVTIHPELEPSTKAKLRKRISRLARFLFHEESVSAVFPLFGHLKSHSCAPLAYHGRQQAGQDGESQPSAHPTRVLNGRC